MIKEIEAFECEFKGEKFYIDFSDKENPVKNELIDKKVQVEVCPTSENETPYFVIYVTDLCNMKCEYCFNKMGTIQRSEIKPNYSIEKLIEFFRTLKVDNINIRFFGGEPTLNTEWIIDCVERMELEVINFHYNIFTNGLQLDEEFIQFCVEKNFQFFVSLAFEDEEYKGKLYGKKVEKNVQKILRYTQNVVGSVVWSAHERHSIIKMIKKYSAIGVKYITLILNWGDEYSIDAHMNVKKELEDIADYFISQTLNHKNWDVYLHPIIAYISGMLGGKPGHLDACACGKNMAAIATNGDIFPCHCFTVHKGFESGNISELKWVKRFMDLDVEDWSNCKECNLRYHCRGKCYLHNFLINSRILDADLKRCIIEKEIIACSAYILKKISENKAEYKALKRIIRMKNEDNTYH